MELWQINTMASNKEMTKALQSKSAAFTSDSAKSEYAKILAEKIANARNDMERMSEIQEELDKNRELHEELTGTVKDDDSGSSPHVTTDTIKRIMPDGSILFMKVQGNEIIEQFKKKPHFVAVADPSAPQSESGHIAVTMKMTSHLDLFDLLI